MGLWDKLGGLFGRRAGGGTERDDAVHLYIQCDRCGARVHVRLSPQHDLVQDFGTGGYFVRKEVMDSKCFRLMYADVRLDAGYRITSQEIEGGRFLTREEFEGAGPGEPPGRT